jgi:hypothetical protein
MAIDMPKTQIQLKTTKDDSQRRAKHTRLEINKKRGDFPLKAANTSSANDDEISIAARQLGRTVVNQHTLLIKPIRLREIVANPTEHQNVKDAIRNALAPHQKNTLNIIYPLLLNQRAPNEKTLQPFPQPNQKIVEKLFDLLDVEGVDIMVTPVALDDRHEAEWAAIGADVFSNRKADFVDEYAPSGLIPSGVSEGTAQSMAATYLRNGFQSLTFDLAGRRVKEGWMRGIIDSTPIWDKLLILGVNVPYYNWHGTFRNPIMPMYDLLVSVYGFDSFSGVTVGYSGEPEKPERLAKKMALKRYCITETYGAYNKQGLATILQNARTRCSCPVCRLTRNPIQLYERDPTQSDLDELTADLKIHRLHVTHGEMKDAYALIDKGRYHSHLSTKRAATNELQSILDAIGPEPS